MTSLISIHQYPKNYLLMLLILENNTPLLTLMHLILFFTSESLFSLEKNSTWIKNNGSLFDVTMGSFDEAELCELVGLFLLSGLASIIGKSYVGLYRDDGLAILENTPGPDTERIKKKL